MQTYEIMNPKDVLAIASTARSGRVVQDVVVLGVDLDESVYVAYQEFLKLADKKKEANDDDILGRVPAADRAAAHVS